MGSGFRVAIVGATGAVGQEFLRVIEKRSFPVASLKLLASERSAGRQVEALGVPHTVEALGPEALEGVDIAFFSAGASVSREYAPIAVQQGAVVIDNSSAFRMDPEVPLVVPEVNAAEALRHRGIIANPNCSTIILVVALKPLHDAAVVTRVVVSTYQAVSGAGARAMRELEEQLQAFGRGQEPPEPRVLPYGSGAVHYPIAFNVIPQVDAFSDGAYTKEEWKMVNETRKILGAPDLRVSATTVRVPVLRSHSESVLVETQRKLTAQQARRLLQQAPGVQVIDDPSRQEYPMPLYASGTDPVYVGRIREDLSSERGLKFWVVGDQIRKGAALNAVQIAEHLIASGALRGAD